MYTCNSNVSLCQLFLLWMYFCSFSCVVTRYCTFLLIPNTSQCLLLIKLGGKVSCPLSCWKLFIWLCPVIYSQIRSMYIYLEGSQHNTLGEQQGHIPNFHSGHHLKVTPTPNYFVRQYIPLQSWFFLGLTLGPGTHYKHKLEINREILPN